MQFSLGSSLINHRVSFMCHYPRIDQQQEITKILSDDFLKYYYLSEVTFSHDKPLLL